MPHITKRSLLAVFGLGLILFPMTSSAIVLTTLEPIVGYQRSQRLVPNPHTHDHLVYGARFTAGLLLFSVEGEYTRGTDSETFPTMSTKDTTDQARLGLRSTFRLLGFVHLFVRAGGQARRNVHEETISGVTTSVTEPIRYNPYAGAGLRVNLASHFSLTGDLTTTFRNFPSMNDNEYMTTLSLAIDIP